MINKIYHIGFGAVATALMEVFNLENKFYKLPFIIVEPKDIKLDILKGRNYVHIKKALTKDNINELLKDIDDKTLIIDLTVELDSLMIIKKTIETKSFYINTSVENWENFDHPEDKMKLKYSEFKKNTLYYRSQEVNKLLKGTKTTRILNMGFNPGAIQEFAKLGLKKYGLSKNIELEKGNYAKLGHDLGLKTVFVVEYDSQTTNLKAKKDLFLNTWSCDGFASEATDYVMISLNKSDELKLSKKFKLIKPTGNKNTRIRFIPTRGMDLSSSNVTLDPNGKMFYYDEGLLIPHAEIITMSDFFHYNGDSPTILYCYRCSDVANDSLDYVRDNDYKPLKKNHVLENNDILDGFDSIGARLQFENGDEYWSGSVLDIETTRNLGFKYGQSTTVQVAGTLFAAILYMMKNPKEGYLEPEEVQSKFIFKHAKKYYGKCYFKKLKITK